MKVTMTFNAEFKFTYETIADFDRDRASGFIPNATIVRVNLVNRDGLVIDRPIYTKEEYLQEIEKINQNDYIVEASAYTSNYYFDINDYD